MGFASSAVARTEQNDERCSLRAACTNCAEDSEEQAQARKLSLHSARQRFSMFADQARA